MFVGGVTKYQETWGVDNCSGCALGLPVANRDAMARRTILLMVGLMRRMLGVSLFTSRVSLQVYCIAIREQAVPSCEHSVCASNIIDKTSHYNLLPLRSRYRGDDVAICVCIPLLCNTLLQNCDSRC